MVMRSARRIGCESVDLHIRGEGRPGWIGEVGRHAAQRRLAVWKRRVPVYGRERETRQLETERREPWYRHGATNAAEHARRIDVESEMVPAGRHGQLQQAPPRGARRRAIRVPQHDRRGIATRFVVRIGQSGRRTLEIGAPGMGDERSGERSAVGVDQESRVANLLGCYRLEVLSFAEQDVERTLRCEVHPRFGIEETAARGHREAGPRQVRHTVGSAIRSAMAEVD